MFYRVLGNGTVLMPQTQLQSMFDTPVKGAIMEPQIYMKQQKVILFCTITQQPAK